MYNNPESNTMLTEMVKAEMGMEELFVRNISDRVIQNTVRSNIRPTQKYTVEAVSSLVAEVIRILRRNYRGKF